MPLHVLLYSRAEFAGVAAKHVKIEMKLARQSPFAFYLLVD